MSQFRTTTPHMLRANKEYQRQTLMGGLSGFESPVGLDRRDRIEALRLLSELESAGGGANDVLRAIERGAEALGGRDGDAP